jgi:putative PEP-CTERM system TPR-repeat lipoprotein
MVRLVSPLVLLLALTACDNTTPEEHLAEAQRYFGEANYRTAVIELKNALQKNPELAAARLLLGRADVALGDYPNALREFERAMDLGLTGDELTVGLLDSKNHLGRQQEVIGELAGDRSLPPALAVILGDAYVNAGDLDKARPLYLEAVALGSANRGLGTIAAMQGDTERAEHYLGRAVEIEPADREAWLKRGELALATSSFDVAESAFSRARDLPGGALSGGLGLARTYLATGRLEEAETEVTEVLRRAPGLYPAHYVDALIKFRGEDVDGAEAALRQVQRVEPDHLPSLLLMGAVQFQRGQLNQAEDSLLRFLARQPDNESAAKLLASVRIRKDDLAGAVETLTPFVGSSNDPQLLAMAGTVLLRLGRAGEATPALERAVAVAPDAATFRNQLALSLLSSGDEERAAAELRSAIDVDPDQFQSDYLLALVHLKNGEFETAERSARSMIEKSPALPLGYNLLGAALMGRDDEAGARQAFLDALAQQPDFLPAAGNLARLDERAGDQDAARRRFEAVLEARPEHVGAHLALADLLVRHGDLPGAEDHLRSAVGIDPDSLRGQLGLTRLYLAQNRLADAEEPAADVLRLAPTLTDGLILNAELALRRGDLARARRHGEQLQNGIDDRTSPAVLVAVGGLQRRVGLRTLARANLARADEAAPGGRAAIELARIDVLEGHPGAARERLAAIEPGSDLDEEIRLVTAEILLADGNREAAMAALEAEADSGSRDAVLRLASLRLAAGDVEAARRGLEHWLADQPGDLGARIMLADAMLRGTDVSQAIAQYESMATSANPVVLNNLAWLYMERGDARALSVAERAYEVAPHNGDIADTFGWILVLSGQPERAIDYIRQSADQRPTNPTIRYHLAIAYLDSGQTDAGRQALEEAVAMGEFPEIDDARARLAELSAS